MQFVMARAGGGGHVRALELVRAHAGIGPGKVCQQKRPVAASLFSIMTAV